MKTSEKLAPGQTRFKIYGTDPDEETLISGSLFANKLGVLVRALKEADRLVNRSGESVHDYKIARLQSTAPTVTLIEVRRPKFDDILAVNSGIGGFEDCANAILEGDRERALSYGAVPKHIKTLAGGASKSFGYGEIWTRAEKSEESIFRVDEFLGEQSIAVEHPEIVRPVDDGTDWYKGVIEGSFDGAIKAVDLRGKLPEIKLILTAGGKQLDCICRDEDVQIIRENLNSRVRVSGRAFYDGRSGLPRRIEVHSIDPMFGDVDFSRWRGAFEPFEALDWDIGEQ